MTDNFPGKAVVLVTLGVGRRGHVWLPILGCNESWRGHHRGQLCHGSGRMVNKLTKPQILIQSFAFLFRFLGEADSTGNPQED